MARKFVDAGLVEQHGAGHCSLAAASFCTLMKIRAYLREGEVPPPPEWGPEGRELEGGKWDRCARDEWPWKSGMAAWKPRGAFEDEEVEDYAPEEERVMRAWGHIRDVSASHVKFWGMRDGRMDVDLWRLAELRGEARFEDGRYVMVQGGA